MKELHAMVIHACKVPFRLDLKTQISAMNFSNVNVKV